MRRLVALPVASFVSLVALAACRDEAEPAPVAAVEPPVASPEAIPDAPVSGRIHDAPFVLRDARYVMDRRAGYAHTDIALSSGSAEGNCAPVSPATATTVWLRLEGANRITSANLRVGPGSPGPWSAHYQVFEEGAWQGVGDGNAVVSLHEPGPDGHLSGGLAVCFSDKSKSCVSGSFEAAACPPRIDQTVRGTMPPEAIPPAYLQRVLLDAGPTGKP